MPKAAPTRRTVSDAHKAALAKGRDESRLVRAYLDAIGAPKRKGRQRTVESINRRLAAIDKALGSASTIIRLQLLQEQSDLREELASKEARPADLDALRAGFVKVAKSYGARKGISYATWRSVGVDAGTLKAAGITR